MSENRTPAYEQEGFAMTCRSWDEYRLMFELDEAALTGKKVLDIASGASSFAAEAASFGVDVYAADPLFAKSPSQLEAYGKSEIADSTSKLEKLTEHFDWSYYKSLNQHRQRREVALQTFVHDFATNLREAEVSDPTPRYVAAALPDLPFPDQSFDHVLCSHFLFLYAGKLDETFHLNALLEMVRLMKPGGDVRVYPLLSLTWEPYPNMDALLAELYRRSGAKAEFRQSQLPFIPGSKHYLYIR